MRIFRYLHRGTQSAQYPARGSIKEWQMRILGRLALIILTAAAVIQGQAGCAAPAGSEPAAGGAPAVTTAVCESGSPELVAAPPTVKGKEFMITFDDGPCRDSTAYILEQLRQIKKADGTPVKAGFFLIGQDKSRTVYHDIWQSRYGTCPEPGVTSYPDLVRAIAREGHIIGVHTQHHPDLEELEPADVEREILDCYQAILATGVSAPKIFRSPRLHNPKHFPPSLQADWRVVGGELTKDYLPLIAETEVAENCRKVIQEAAESPVVLAFHDFRGLPGHRLDFRQIVTELTAKDHFTLVDFDPARVAVPWKLAPRKSQALEDFMDMTRVWRQRLSTPPVQ
jgi:peptidoglycan/xylan/chitin deacetylase (PgdA/CDA1 family)